MFKPFSLVMGLALTVGECIEGCGGMLVSVEVRVRLSIYRGRQVIH